MKYTTGTGAQIELTPITLAAADKGKYAAYRQFVDALRLLGESAQSTEARGDDFWQLRESAHEAFRAFADAMAWTAADFAESDFGAIVEYIETGALPATPPPTPDAQADTSGGNLPAPGE